MGVDTFLKLEDIEGESQDKRYMGWIEVISFSWGIRQAAGVVGEGLGAATPPERCDFDEFTFRKTLDAASPQLAIACCRGTRLKEAKLDICRATGQKQEYYQIRLSEVIVARVKMEIESEKGSGLPTETISLNFGKIEWAYTQTDWQSGRKMGCLRANWDLRCNRGGT